MTGEYPWDLVGSALHDRMVVENETVSTPEAGSMLWRRGRLRGAEGERPIGVRILDVGRQKLYLVRDDLEATAPDSASAEATLAMLVHDLKAPLQGIMGNAELLLAGRFGELADEQSSAITRIGENSEHLFDLANRIQLASDLGDALIEPEAVDAGTLIERIVERMEGKAAARDIRLLKSVQQDLAPLCGDAFHLAQAIQNLIDNALNACARRGTVRIGASLAGGRLARIDVSGRNPADSTPAELPGSAQRRLFHGLGLSIARRIADAHGGSLWAERTGTGAVTVSFTVPLWTSSNGARHANGNGKVASSGN
jgi:signal transduction histidine kinase